ncbi:hypothetical protein [Paenibacillus kobensis]|uniref:hypothetical protein n=1 Tax=Paenibacillus kobensis TaxID=59841 RepID=UPI000FD9DF64|nr:hypothetical protein [Paenibacillus kobensis]
MTALHDRDGSTLHITAMDTKLLEQAAAMRGPVIVSRGRIHSLSIPLVGHDGIPVKHEVEFERRLL